MKPGPELSSEMLPILPVPWFEGPAAYIDAPMNPPVGSVPLYPVMAPIEFNIGLRVPVVVGFMTVLYAMLWALTTMIPRFVRSAR